jgi:ElaB/YqjD/DUF883 family membrane-anchored ribosome-binding protein
MEDDVSQQALTADEYGNYDSPALRTLHEVWEDYDRAAVDVAEVLRVVGNIEDYVNSQIRQLESEPVGDSSNPNRESILDGFYGHLRGLELMRSYFVSENDELVEEAFEILQESTNAMVRGLAGLVEEAEQVAPRICIRCQRENDQHASNCRRCGAILPVLSDHAERRLLAIDDQVSESEEAATTPNFIEVSDAHQAWFEGTLEEQAVLAQLDAVRERQEAELDQLTETVAELEQATEGPQPRLLEALARLATALEHGQQALDDLADAIEEGSREAAQEALSRYAEATIEILAAHKELEAEQIEAA